MEQLRHNGVLVPSRYEGNDLVIKVKGAEIKLTPEQGEMALAWAKKVGTPYVEDRVFAENFHRDFSEKLGTRVKPGDVDYTKVISLVEEERRWKADLSREERKRLASGRKAQREANKERFGFAWVDGVQVEVGNYAVEPSSIFMGRGKHPLRGRWKEGPQEQDVELNLSRDALRPLGSWKSIVWEPDAMWIARWRDKLSGKMKYVGFSESSILKQKKEIEKFDKAMELQRNLQQVQRHIWKGLNAENTRRRKIATICFLIDKLKIRVGDEKDPDEADTVGASTLRPEHIRSNGDGTVTFNFLGKDSVPHVFTVKLPVDVIRNLNEFSDNAKSTLFDGIGSKHISGFLDEVVNGLSSKVFRTFYASKTVRVKLERTHVNTNDPEYRKKHVATMANLEAAKICNHRRTIPKTWKASLDKKRMRRKIVQNRAKEAQTKLKMKTSEREERYEERMRKQEEKLKMIKEKLDTTLTQLAQRKQQNKPVNALEKRIRLQQSAVKRQKQRLRELKAKHREQMKKSKSKLENRRLRDEAAIDKLSLRIKAQQRTRDYNLATSLKSYIDPRIYYEWGREVDYDWKRYYPKALQRKFSWIEKEPTS
ncbi:MAG: hypothetical protein PVF15_00625 [Candidatus Bathyarchaeota archaeon]|jgi:DNA topoisomerase-1